MCGPCEVTDAAKIVCRQYEVFSTGLDMVEIGGKALKKSGKSLWSEAQGYALKVNYSKGIPHFHASTVVEIACLMIVRSYMEV